MYFIKRKSSEMSNNYQYNQQQQFGQAAWTAGGQDFQNRQQDFPSLDSTTQQQQVAETGFSTGTAVASDNPIALSSAVFTPNSAEFVPEGVVAGNESFPDLDALSNIGKKSKKVQPTKAQLEAEKLAAQQALPTKGKPPVFFQHQGYPSQE